MTNSKGGSNRSRFKMHLVLGLLACCLMKACLGTAAAESQSLERRLEAGFDDDGENSLDNQILEGADNNNDDDKDDDTPKQPVKQQEQQQPDSDDTVASKEAEKKALQATKKKHRTSANVAKQSLNDFEIEDIQARYKRGEYQIHIESIQPKGGPIRGQTQVLVRFDNLAPFVDAYPHPRCKFGSNSRIVDAQYVKCTKKEEDFYSNENSAKKDGTCVQCEAAPATTVAEIVSFTVSLSGNFDDSASSIPYRYYNNLEVHAIYPRYGPKDGDTVVQVWGKNFIDFGDDFRCNFGTRSTKAHMITSDFLWCRAPASDVVARPMPFSVSLNRQQNSRDKHMYWYYNMQSIWEVIPDYGSMTGDTKIMIKGNNFKPWEWEDEVNNQNDTFCSFGVLGKVPAQVLTGGVIECIAPENNQKVNKVMLKITINNQNYTDDKFEFSYYNPPSVMEVEPKIGPVEGGTKVNIWGSNFEHKTVICQFGNVNITGTVISTSKIECQTPKMNKSGEIPLKISYVKDRFASEPINFKFFANPNITAVKNVAVNVTMRSSAIEAKVIDAQLTAKIYQEAVKKAQEEGKPVPPPPPSLSITEIKAELPPLPTENLSPSILEQPEKTEEEQQQEGKTSQQAGIEEKTGELPPTEGELSGPQKQTTFAKGVTHATEGGGGQAIKKTTETIKLAPQPELLEGLNACGPTEGYTQFNVIGSNFIEHGFGAAKCIFNQTVYMNATVVSDNLIVCDSPPLETTTGDMWYQISVTLDGSLIVNSSQVFKYYRQPVVTSISPSMGPLEGGTVSIIRGKGFAQPNICSLTMRQEQMFMDFKVINDTAIKVTSRAVEKPGAILVSLSGNNQQYINDITLHFRDPENTFEYYQAFNIISVQPEAVTNEGGTPISIKAVNFEQFRWDNDTLKDVTIYCRFIKQGDDKSVIGEEQVMTKESGTEQICKSPKSNYLGDSKIELSINRQQWHTLDHKVNFFNGPKVTSVSPTYGVTKNPKGSSLVITGENLECPKSDCSKIKIRFTNDKGDMIVVDGQKDGNNIKCKIPKYPAPETLTVDVAMNGIEYTNGKITYGFMDPYVLQITPRLFSPKGTTQATLHGYGFSQQDSTKQTVQFSSSKTALMCTSSKDDGTTQSDKCINQITVVDEHTITVNTIAQGTTTLNGKGFDSKDAFNIDLIDMDGEYFNNGIQLYFYNEISLSNVSATFAYANQEKPIMIQSDFGWGTSNDYQTFRKHGNFSCRFTGTTPEIKQVIVPAIMEVSPVGGYVQGKLPNQIRCRTPKWEKVESVNLDISVNGIDYFGSYSIQIVEALTNIRISPMSGPIQGGTKVKLYGTGYTQSDPKDAPVYIKFGNLASEALDKSNVAENDTWSNDKFYNQELHLPKSILNDAEANDQAVTDEQALKSYMSISSPDISNQFSSDQYDSRYAGGPVYIQLTERVPITAFTHKKGVDAEQFTDYIETVYPDSSALEYYFYRQPFVTKVEPLTGLAVGGTKITIQGGWFQQLPQYGVFPFCKIGSDVIRAQFLTTNRIICQSLPSSDTINAQPISVSLNGVDWVSTNFEFSYYERPILDDISPKNGKAEGGTEIMLKGQKFSKSKNLKLVRCRFRQAGASGQVEDENAPTKVVPAYFIDKETMKCATPAGWKGNDTVLVDLTFNGVDFTEATFPFTFYNIFGSFPKSGPSEATNQYIQVRGAGFDPKWKIQCHIDGQDLDPVKVLHNVIRCPMVPPNWPSDKYATVDFLISVDGQKHSLGNFHYYKQIVIESINPTSGPNEGNGNVYISGRYFRSDFEGSKPNCRIGNTVAKATIIDSTTIKCTIDHKLPLVDEGQSLLMTASLNSYSWVQSEFSFQPYGIYDIFPTAGPLQDNTNINVIGKGFVNELQSQARCKFGTDENYQIVEAQVLDDENMICKSPSENLALPDSASKEISVPFSIAFQDDIYFPFTMGVQRFRLYKHPETIMADPMEGLVTKLTEVYITADPENGFSQPIPAAGKNTIQSDQFGIKCKFGRFGTSPATYINSTTILCLTPNIVDDPSSIGEEMVVISVAMNGIDYNEDVTRAGFTFIGTGGNLSLWVILMGSLVIGLVAISVLFFVSGLQSYMNTRNQLQPRVVQDAYGQMQVRSGSQMSQANINRNLINSANQRLSAMHSRAQGRYSQGRYNQLSRQGSEPRGLR